MKQMANRILVVGFVVSLLVMSVTFFLLPIKQFSELENRYLHNIPRFTWDNLISKQFADEAESFVTDHFPLRAYWIRVKSAMEQLRLQQENNGIYKGKDGYLFEKFVEPDYAKIQQYTEAVREFAIGHPDANMTFMLAPTSIGIYPDRLPWKAPFYPESIAIDYIADKVHDSLSFINGIDVLSPHASEQIFYRTDHHWTTLGAYYAYVAYIERMGWKPLGKEKFRIETVSDTFLGSYHTRSQFTGLTPDTIQAFIPNKQVQSEIYIVDKNETVPSLYEDSFLMKKDQYSYFLGGVHALMTIKSDLDPMTTDKDKLLVVKDSYAHNFIPFLTSHVSEIHVIDIRYYNGSIRNYMSENGIKDVLLLFNTATFVDNGEILKINN